VEKLESESCLQQGLSLVERFEGDLEDEGVG